MPRKEHNIARQRTKDFQITKNGLLTKRADLLGELITLDAQRESKRLDIEAIDRVLVNVLAYDGDLDAVKPTGQRINYFKHGELGRKVLETLRTAGKTMTAKEIALIVGPQKGLDMTDKKALKYLKNNISRSLQRSEGRFVKRYVDAFGVNRWGT